MIFRNVTKLSSLSRNRERNMISVTRKKVRMPLAERAEAVKPLKWSSTLIIFDTEDHPDRTTAVGCLSLLVSPTIRNLKVTKMLVDGGAGLNLISPVVVKRLQIPDGDLRRRALSKGLTRGGASQRERSRCP